MFLFALVVRAKASGDSQLLNYWISRFIAHTDHYFLAAVRMKTNRMVIKQGEFSYLSMGESRSFFLDLLEKLANVKTLNDHLQFTQHIFNHLGVSAEIEVFVAIDGEFSLIDLDSPSLITNIDHSVFFQLWSRSLFLEVEDFHDIHSFFNHAKLVQKQSYRLCKKW